MTEMEFIIEELRALRREVAQMRSDRMMSTSEAAEYMGCSAQTIRTMVRRGELKAHMAGRDLRIRKIDIDDLLYTDPAEEILDRLRRKTA